MDLFGKRSLELFHLLKIQYLDLSERYERLVQEYAKERQTLLDRIMVLSQPMAYRELHREPQSKEVRQFTPQRLHWPGIQTRPRPPIQAQQATVQSEELETQEES